jgi:MYXO-CTERM domain-containing protein
LSDEYDPLLALLVIAALLAIHRRRGRGKRDDLV